MKHFKHFMLTVLVALVGNISAFAYDFEVDGIYYNTLSIQNLTCEVTYGKYVGYGSYSSDVVIPSSVTYAGKTFKVTSIGSHAFSGCSDLTSVNIPNSVTEIGQWAFGYCSSLTSIEIPGSVAEIGPNPFMGCTNLNKIKVSGEDHYYVKNDCLISKEGLLITGLNKSSVEIPSSVISIGRTAFSYCYNLTAINIPNSVIEIGYEAFERCSLTSITIPNSVISIGGWAFSECTSLTSISIPNSVTEIGPAAFQSCSCLTSVYITDIVAWCKIKFVELSNPLCYANNLYLNNELVTNLVIPNNVTSIGDYVFQGYGYLTSITIPNSVTSIGKWAFSYCRSLTSINIPNSVTSIGYEAFQNCSGLTSINIPNSVTSIGYEAFYGCSGLTSINIPNSVTSIGNSAFSGCSGLKEITSLNTTPPTIDYATFFGVSKTECILKVPDEAVDDYNVADYWKEFNNIVPLETEYNLTDGEEYANNKTLENSTVNYTRNFTSDAWQALYIPFAMAYEDWADKADVAYINNVHQWDDDNDGVIDRTALEFITKKNGSIEANKPYVIRPKQIGEVTFTSENTTLYATSETDGFVDCRSTTTEYTLYGTYQEKTDMYEKGYYAMADGDFKQAESASVKLSPFRTYLKIENRTGAGTVQNAKRISIMVDGIVDNDATGIEGITQNSSLETQNCYNLAGQKVNRGYKGIAIKNGKKYIVK